MEDADNVCRQMVAMILFVHPDNRPKLYEVMCLSTGYFALMSYRDQCIIKSQRGFVLDQEEVNQGWHKLEAELNAIIVKVGDEVFGN